MEEIKKCIDEQIEQVRQETKQEINRLHAHISLCLQLICEYIDRMECDFDKANDQNDKIFDSIVDVANELTEDIDYQDKRTTHLIQQLRDKNFCNITEYVHLLK